MNIRYKRALILAPHTDDGELGAGGFIAKLISCGVECQYLAFSSCEDSVPLGLPKEILKTEVVNATSVLGIPSKNVSVKKYRVRMFNFERQQILDDLIKMRNSFKPDIILTPSSMDIHQDHRVIHEETLRAFKDKTIFGYEMPWNNLQFSSTLIVSLTENEIDAKVASIREYASQKGRRYMENGYLKSLSQVRGGMINSDYGEAFEVIRLVL